MELLAKICLAPDMEPFSMTQTKKKCGSYALSRFDFWMVWGCQGTLWVYFIVLIRTDGRKENLDENDFYHCYDDYFKSAILEVP